VWGGGGYRETSLSRRRTGCYICVVFALVTARYSSASTYDYLTFTWGYRDGRCDALFVLFLAGELEEERGINFPDSETRHEDGREEGGGSDYAKNLELCFAKAGEVVCEIYVATTALVGRKAVVDLR
jgi:hypothetical protein